MDRLIVGALSRLYALQYLATSFPWRDAKIPDWRGGLKRKSVASITESGGGSSADGTEMETQIRSKQKRGPAHGGSSPSSAAGVPREAPASPRTPLDPAEEDGDSLHGDVSLPSSRGAADGMKALTNEMDAPAPPMAEAERERTDRNSAPAPSGAVRDDSRDEDEAEKAPDHSIPVPDARDDRRLHLQVNSVPAPVVPAARLASRGERKPRRPNWKPHETLKLIECRLQHPHGKGESEWNAISDQIPETAGAECQGRWDTLVKNYKKIKRHCETVCGKRVADVTREEFQGMQLNYDHWNDGVWYNMIDEFHKLQRPSPGPASDAPSGETAVTRENDRPSASNELSPNLVPAAYPVLERTGTAVEAAVQQQPPNHPRRDTSTSDDRFPSIFDFEEFDISILAVPETGENV